MTTTTPVAPVVDTGPLDWRIGIVDQGGRPTPEFQRRWATQRGNNALIGTITTGNGVPTGVPVQNQVYIDIGSTPFTFYVGNNGVWDTVGVINFTDLKDVPHSYTTHGLNFVQVNSGATGLIFTSLSAGIDELGTPAEGDILYRGSSSWLLLPPSTSGNILTTQGTGAAPIWAPAPATGVTSVSLTMPSIFSVAGSPVTGSGGFTVTLGTETANLVFAGPSSGGASAPTFRSLVAADLPLFSSSLAGAVPSSGGGTTNYLRADGTWDAPPGSGSSATRGFGFSNPGLPAANTYLGVGSWPTNIVFATAGPVEVVAGTAATASAVFTIEVLVSGTWTSIGTLTFAASGTVATLAIIGSPVTVTAGQLLRLVTPVVQDATLADIGGIVNGT